MQRELFKQVQIAGAKLTSCRTLCSHPELLTDDVEPAGTDMLKHPLIATLLLISIAVVSCSASSHHAVDDEHHDGDSLDELEAMYRMHMDRADSDYYDAVLKKAWHAGSRLGKKAWHAGSRLGKKDWDDTIDTIEEANLDKRVWSAQSRLG
ncbi:hypothetical protein BOX15_Mlig031239g1 [Macrostomum lignano]|uniref:Uncharacterized protein n=1 Tax=Macrostomum lignano TaxID=282301 RepID=A0A267ECX1_9PLAT|nr:hypothetical protein BOX15_Mlig031239g1 [Macrostomum lignano]